MHCYSLGLHQGKYKALVQFMPITVIRVFDKDNYLDFTSGKEGTGIFGINIHRANLSGKSIYVNQCLQVVRFLPIPASLMNLFRFAKRFKNIVVNPLVIHLSILAT